MEMEAELVVFCIIRHKQAAHITILISSIGWMNAYYLSETIFILKCYKCTFVEYPGVFFIFPTKLLKKGSKYQNGIKLVYENTDKK